MASAPLAVVATAIPDVLVLEPRVFGDERGFFFEAYNQRVLAEVAGITEPFVQDNHSRSLQHVLRGLHYQLTRPQGKLVRVIAGAVFDVAVDLRRSSPTFGKWTGMTLSASDRRMAWIPKGFAHGFLVLSEMAEVLYKTTDFYAPEDERCVIWNDAKIGIEWPLAGAPVLSARDRAGVTLAEAEVFGR
jgi:dTDP-4-dehydrorhamnose 3,5-epimerase